MAAGIIPVTNRVQVVIMFKYVYPVSRAEITGGTNDITVIMGIKLE